MKIGHLAAGLWRSVHLDTAKALHRLGQDVQVYTEDKRVPTIARFSRLDEDGIAIWGIHDERRNPWLWLPDRLGKPFLGGRRFFTTLFAIWRYLRRTRCDVYMVEGDGLGIFLALLSKVMKFRWVQCVHDHEHFGVLLGYPGEPSNPARTRLKLWMMRQADAIRANSRVTRDIMVQAGLDPAAITVIPLHYTPRMRVEGDLAEFRRAARADIRARHGLPPACPLVVALCRLTPFKGLDLAVRAFALARQRHADARFVICGGDRQVPGVGSYRALLEKLAAELGIADAILFAGNIEPTEVKRYYAAADLHLVPSYIETFNYSAVESALTGTRTLMTDRIGSGPWLDEFGAALVVPGREPADYGAAMVRALETPFGEDAALAVARRTEAGLAVDTLAPQLAALLERTAGTPS